MKTDKATRIKIENYNRAREFAKKALADIGQAIDQLPDVEPASSDQITWANIGDLYRLNKMLIEAQEWADNMANKAAANV